MVTVCTVQSCIYVLPCLLLLGSLRYDLCLLDVQLSLDIFQALVDKARMTLVCVSFGATQDWYLHDRSADGEDGIPLIEIQRKDREERLEEWRIQ